MFETTPHANGSPGSNGNARANPESLAGGGVANDGASEQGRRLAASLNEEEQELWRQLRRKRDFEGRIAEKRAQLAELKERRRNISTAHSEVLASVEHLQQEVEFTLEQGREIEHDVAVMKESNRILQQVFQQQQQQKQMQQQRQGGTQLQQMSTTTSLDSRNVLAEEKKRQESAELQHEQINHLRAHVDKLRQEKVSLQQRQQALFDKQRSAEQDRNRLLGTLQDERSSINEVRLDRLKLWEERSRMERQMAQIVQEVQGRAAGLQAAPAPATVPGASGGVRGRVTSDTPQAFADAPVAAGTAGSGRAAAPWNASGPGLKEEASRPHWTSFGAPAGDGAGAAHTSKVGGGFPGGGFGGGGGGGAGGGLGGSGASLPPSFGDLAGGASRGALSQQGSQDTASFGGGITEWAGRMRESRTGSKDPF